MMVHKRLYFKLSTVFEEGGVYYAILSINIYWNIYGAPDVFKIL